MKYWISIKSFQQGHQIDSRDDDNKGNGYTLKAARRKAAKIDDIRLDGQAQGTEAKVYDWNGEPA